MEIKAGDFIITKEKQLLRIMQVIKHPTGTYYDLKGYKGEYIKSVPRNKLRHLGKIMPEQKMTKTIKILYG